MAPTLHDFIARARRLAVLTGAGCSTDSGIPDYRGPDGAWRAAKPIQYGDFVRSEGTRRFYWARSYRGYPRFAAAAPNRAHRALAALERAGKVHHLITQNVDGLHRLAGSEKAIELHGRIDRVVCLRCSQEISRAEMQLHLAKLNGAWSATETALAPDGDAEVDRAEAASFEVPPCPCGGILKPSVVFFGESVPRDRVAAAMSAVEESDALLVVGSSLAVWSGYRFPLRAAELRIPIAILNIGSTRADHLSAIRVEENCGEALSRVVVELKAADAVS